VSHKNGVLKQTKMRCLLGIVFADPSAVCCFAKLQLVASYFNILNFINYENNAHENADMHQLSFSSSILVGQQFTPEESTFMVLLYHKTRQREGILYS
jgi:hypothetical protein